MSNIFPGLAAFSGSSPLNVPDFFRSTGNSALTIGLLQRHEILHPRETDFPSSVDAASGRLIQACRSCS